jgi:hypothetical protein
LGLEYSLLDFLDSLEEFERNGFTVFPNLFKHTPQSLQLPFKVVHGGVLCFLGCTNRWTDIIRQRLTDTGKEFP